MAKAEPSRKIPIAQFCKEQGLNNRQVYTLFSKHARLKCKVEGEKSSRVNLDEWDKILRTA